VPESAPPYDDAGVETLAHRVVGLLAERGLWLATAESLTGGLLAGAITGVPGASRVFRGGVVAYASDVKHSMLGVDSALLASAGAVDPEVAAQLAVGVRARLTADVGLSTTGVAGPDPQDGRPPGTVFVGLADAQADRSFDASWPVAEGRVGDRSEVRRRPVVMALQALVEHLDTGPAPSSGARGGRGWRSWAERCRRGGLRGLCREEEVRWSVQVSGGRRRGDPDRQ
jgi:PncC family amidohydrolase